MSDARVTFSFLMSDWDGMRVALKSAISHADSESDLRQYWQRLLADLDAKIENHLRETKPEPFRVATDADVASGKVSRS